MAGYNYCHSDVKKVVSKLFVVTNPAKFVFTAGVPVASRVCVLSEL